MKKLIASILLLYFFIQTFPRELSGKSKGIPFYRVLFTEKEWKKEYPDIPGSLAYLPENIFNISDTDKFKILFGSYNENVSYEKMTENNFFPEDMHKEAIEYFTNNDKSLIYKNIKDFIHAYAGEKYAKLEFDVKSLARQTFLLNYYYIKYNNSPQVLTTLYYAYNLLFKLTANVLRIPDLAENAIFLDYSAFKNNKRKYLADKDLKKNNLDLKILNFFCYRYIHILNKIIFKNNPDNKIALGYALLINRCYKWYARKYPLLERLIKFSPHNLDLKLELLRSYFYLGKDKQYGKLIKNIRKKHPDSKELLTPIIQDIKITKKIMSWDKNYKSYSAEKFKKKWYEIVELLLERNNINELNRFLSLATAKIKQEKRYDFLLLKYYELLCMASIKDNFLAKILNPGYLMQQIFMNNRYIHAYHKYSLMMVKKYPDQTGIFEHIINSSFIMTIFELGKKIEDFKIKPGQDISDEQALILLAIIKTNWQQVSGNLKKIKKSEYEKQLAALFDNIDRIISKRFNDPEFVKTVFNKKSTAEEVLGIIWNDLRAIAREFAKTDWTLEPQDSDVFFMSFFCREAADWISNEKSLESFIQIKNDFKKAAEDKNKYSFIKYFLNLLNRFNEGVLSKYSRYPGLNRDLRRKNKKQVKEVRRFLDASNAIISYLGKKEQQEKSNLKDWKISLKLYGKILYLNKRYLYESYLKDYCKAKFMLTMFQEEKDKRFINAAYYYLGRALIAMKKKESEEIRKSKNMILFQSDSDKLESEIYQNIGYCLNYYKNSNAKYFISYAGMKNSDEKLNLMFFLEQQYAKQGGDKLKFLEICRKTYNDILDNDRINKKMKDIFAKFLIKKIISLLESDKMNNKDLINEYQLKLKKLKDVDKIGTGLFSVGGGSSTNTGLSFFINISKYYFMVEL